MPHQDVPSVVKAEVNFKDDFTTMMNVFYFHAVNAITEALLDALFATLTDWLTTYWAPIASDRIHAYEITLTDLSSLAGRRKTYPIEPDIRGGLNEEPMPANSTVAIKASVGHRGRGKNGRVFWIGLTETQVTGDTLTGGFGTTVTTAMNGLITLIQGVSGFDHVVVPHFVVGGIRPPVVGYEPVTQYQLSDNFVDSQRDRLPNHKRHKRRIIV